MKNHRRNANNHWKNSIETLYIISAKTLKQKFTVSSDAIVRRRPMVAQPIDVLRIECANCFES